MSIGSTIRAGAAYVEVTAETSKLQRNLTSAPIKLQAANERFLPVAAIFFFLCCVKPVAITSRWQNGGGNLPALSAVRQ